MSFRALLMRCVAGGVLCCGVWMPWQCAMAQQAISNPLVRPAGLVAGGGASGAAAPQKTEAQNAAAQSPASPDLRDKATSRLSQEDFNLKQQALNASAIPAPLGSLFNQMMVSAVVGGSVVLRRAEGVATLGGQQVAQTGATGTGGQANGGGGRGANGVGGAGGAVVTSSVLRLKVGQSTNLNGYVLRARVEGMDVFVDWKNEQGAWVAVFFGALESAGVLALTPAKDGLEKVDTSSFDYLKPQVSNRVSGNASVGGSGQNASQNNNGFGSNGGQGSGSTPSF